MLATQLKHQFSRKLQNWSFSCRFVSLLLFRCLFIFFFLSFSCAFFIQLILNDSFQPYSSLIVLVLQFCMHLISLECKVWTMFANTNLKKKNWLIKVTGKFFKLFFSRIYLLLFICFQVLTMRQPLQVNSVQHIVYTFERIF